MLGLIERILKRAIGRKSVSPSAHPGFKESAYPSFKESGLFDPQWYLKKYPEVAQAGIDPLEHYASRGVHENRMPNQYFDPHWYLSHYPDVQKAGVNPFIHYTMYGSRACRDPSPEFDTGWYADQIGSSAIGDELPLAHYLRVGRNQKLPTIDGNRQYRRFLLRERQRFVFEFEELSNHVRAMVYLPKFVVFIEGGSRADREVTIKSLRSQIYDRYAIAETVVDMLPVYDDAPGPNYFIWLRAGDVLHSTALYRFASAINAQPNTDMLYGDEDVLVDGRRSDPFFKPDWSPDYLESFNYIGRAACYRLPTAISLFKVSVSNYDFVLRFTENVKSVQHLRVVLLHKREHEITEDSDVAALTARLNRTGRAGLVRPIVDGLGAYRSDITWKNPPLVSVVIPTAGNVVTIGERKIDLIVNCIERIAQSNFKNLEFIVVDNGDLSESQRQSLEKFDCKMVTFNEPRFNVATKLNLGARHAKGEFLLLMNDDIEPMVPDWIERMLDQFAKPHVGVVGAKLLYPDETTQHVGVVITSGSPDHVRRWMPRSDLGYFYSTCAVRNYSAVTGACMMTRASIYRSVGGYTQGLAVSYNDVDYCLKVRALGLTAVYTPFAELTHFESQSRDAKLDRSEAAYFGKRWAKMVTQDPYYNEEFFNILPSSYRISLNPRQL